MPFSTQNISSTGKRELTRIGKRCEHKFGLLSERLKPIVALAFPPSYRFPTTAYEYTVPQLLSEAEISGDELQQIADFFGVVEDANRGLDYVHHFRVKAEEQLEGELDAELRRLSDLANENGRIDPTNATGWVKVMLYEHNKLLRKMEGLIEAPRAVRIDEIISSHLNSNSP